MAKQLNEKQIKELKQIKEWCISILNYLILRYGETAGLKVFSDLIYEVYEKQDLIGLKHVSKDIIEWAKGIPQKDLDGLNELLKEKFKKNLLQLNNVDLRKIQNVVKKGMITNEDEYRLLISRVDIIYDDDSNISEVEVLNKLLAEYHKTQ